MRVGSLSAILVFQIKQIFSLIKFLLFLFRRINFKRKKYEFSIKLKYFTLTNTKTLHGNGLKKAHIYLNLSYNYKY